jgi:cell division septation protein DedD
MERKLYLNRGGAGQERPSYVKVLLWAAVGLVILMITVPLLTGKKGTKNGLSKSSQDKGGAVVREIPKGVGGMSDSAQQIPPLVAETKEAGDVKVAPLPGMQIFPESQGKTSTTGTEKAAEGLPAAKDQPVHVTSGESAASQAFKALDGALPPTTAKSTPHGAAKSGAAPAAAGQTGIKPKEASATAAATKTPVQATKAKPGGAELYAVQVGSYHEKKHADELLQSLKNKGYAVSVRTKPDPKGGQLYVVQLDPVSDMGKAHTQVAQIQHEEKVKPFVTKLQPGE